MGDELDVAVGGFGYFYQDWNGTNVRIDHHLCTDVISPLLVNLCVIGETTPMRVLITKKYGFVSTMHPNKVRVLNTGDVIDVDTINENGYARFRGYGGELQTLLPSWFQLLDGSIAVRVRIVQGPGEDIKFESTEHPSEDRMIVIGDEFEVSEIRPEGDAYYTSFRHQLTHLLPKWFEVVSVNAGPKVCDCPIDVLMGKGCQCGGT